MTSTKIITRTAIFCGVIILLSVCLQTAIAGDVEPMYMSQPATGDTKEEITELYVRNHKKGCTIYRLTVDENTYLANTCGGLVLIPQ